MNNDIRMQSSVMPSPFTPADNRTGLEEDFGPNRNQLIEELKHSIRTHIIIMNGVSDQLCAYLLKLIDFMTDNDTARRDKEVAHLSYSIVEAASLYISGTIDSFADKYSGEGKEFPEDVKQKSDSVLIEIGKWRSSQDKISAKNAVLAAAASTLNAFSASTGTQYPQLVDINGTPL